MNILLTNDDGINAEGINSLFNVTSRYHNVFMIAPDGEKSACSNAITVRDNIKITRISDNKYSISGFPADCIMLGLNGDFIPEIDFVLSGINHGPNLGDDLFFSGTVAGARTACIFGKPAIAVSMDSYHKPSEYFDNASEFVINFLNEISVNAVQENSNYPMLYNINYPDIPEHKVKGVKYTFTGKRIYKDTYTTFESSVLEREIGVSGNIESVYEEGSDVTELERGFVSITPLKLDCTDFNQIEKKCKLREHQ